MPRLTYNTGSADVAAGTLLIGANIAVSQSRGTSETDVMSQRAVTNEFQKFDSAINELKTGKLSKSEAASSYLAKSYADSAYQPKGDYAYKSDIPELPDMSKYALKTDIPTNVGELANDAGYLTQTALEGNYYNISEINNLVDEIKANNENWQHNYYDKDEVNDLLKKASQGTEADIEEIENRVAVLEAIDHTEFVTHSEIEPYATREEVSEELGKYDESSEVDRKIAAAIAGENIGDLVTKAEAEETYQKKGDYITEDKLEEYSTTEQTADAIAGYVDAAVESLHIEEYAKTSEIADIYATKEEIPTDYLTEHQSLEHLETKAEAEKSHTELGNAIAGVDKKLSETDARLEIAERLCADFVMFNNWQSGYYEVSDKAASTLVQHDGCCYILADVSNVERREFFCHFPPNTFNLYVREYSGEPSQATYLKETYKNGFDLVMELDRNTKFVMAFALMTDSIEGYYLRGIKAGESGNDHVSFSYLEQNYYDKSEIDSKIKESPEIDLTGYATEDFVNSAVDKIDNKLGDYSRHKIDGSEYKIDYGTDISWYAGQDRWQIWKYDNYKSVAIPKSVLAGYNTLNVILGNGGNNANKHSNRMVVWTDNPDPVEALKNDDYEVIYREDPKLKYDAEIENVKFNNEHEWLIITGAVVYNENSVVNSEFYLSNSFELIPAVEKLSAGSGSGSGSGSRESYDDSEIRSEISGINSEISGINSEISNINSEISDIKENYATKNSWLAVNYQIGTILEQLEGIEELLNDILGEND